MGRICDSGMARQGRCEAVDDRANRARPRVRRSRPCGRTADQVAARRLYHGLGFKIFGHEPRAFKIGEKYLDQDEMLLRL